MSVLIKTIFLVPIRDNDGRPFQPRDWRELEQRLHGLAGFSRRVGVYGEWGSGGQVYRDRSREYTISIASWLLLPAWLELVQWTLVRFRQEALYIEVAGIPEVVETPIA